MANRQKGEVAFTAAGKSYRLRFSTNALCELEDITGRGVTDVMLELASWMPPTDDKGKPIEESPDQMKARASKMRMGFVRDVFCAGLRDQNPDINVKEAGDLIQDVGGMIRVMDLINSAFAAGFDTGKKPRPPKPDSLKA